jgi:hypothetical protein
MTTPPTPPTPSIPEPDDARTARLRASLPDEPTRDQIEQIIIDAATNNGTLWQMLVDPRTTRQALGIIFGAAPPPSVNVRVLAEDPGTYYHVVPAPEEADIVAGPRTLAPRKSFQRRLNYLLHTDPAFKAEFEAHAPTAISKAFQFRFPSHVNVVPLPESTTAGVAGADPAYNLFVVLPYSAHDALLDSPYAIAVNGVDASVDVPFSPSLELRSAIAVEAGFKASAYHAGNWQDAVVSMHGQASGWELRVGGAVPRFMVTIGGIHYYAQPANPVPFLKTDTWYYVVGSYDGAQLRLHLNGQLLYTTAVRGPMDPYGGRLTLGRNSNPNWVDRFFGGEIDEVRIWDRPRTLDEIRQYRPRKSRGAEPDTADPSLRAYYPMTEGNGRTLLDHSGYGNNGVLVNAQWVTIPENAP